MDVRQLRPMDSVPLILKGVHPQDFTINTYKESRTYKMELIQYLTSLH